MTRFKPAFPALVSALLIGSVLTAARPHYGGTLRIETAAPADAITSRLVLPLAYETLVAVDPAGGLRPLLAISWEGDTRGTRWVARLRNGVKLHDSSVLSSSQVVTTLRASHPEWQVTADGTAVVIEPGREEPDLPWELADQRNAIAVRQPSGVVVGTGPFRMERIDAGGLALRAHDDYWGGRPFVDVVQIRMGRSPADQLADLEGGRADMVSVQPADVRRLEQRQLRIAASRALELFALVFEPQLATPANSALRRTLASAIDRAAIARVVLQSQAEPADALLPQWLSGYAPFVLARLGEPLSRPAVARLPPERRALALRVAASDSTAQAIAQRIAVNAREAGFALTVQAPAGLGPRFDLRIVRLPVEPTSPGRAIATIMTELGPRTMLLTGRVAAPGPGTPLDEIARVERALLERDVVVPIVHVPELYGLGHRLESWNGPPVSPSGGWNLADVWLGPDGSGTP
jgi:ABC-type transport system substrate-binding protein